MKRFLKTLILLIVGGGFFNACNDPTDVPDILPDEDNVDIQYTDTLSIASGSVKRDSVQTYSLSSQLRYYLCGELNDPVFGKTHSQIYTQFILNGNTPEDDLVNVTLDSLVLTMGLSYDTSSVSRRNYDDFSKLSENEFGVQVHRMVTPMDKDATYFSNQQFEVSDRVGTFHTYNINPKISFNPVEPPSFISIRLDDELGQELLDAGNAFESNKNFQDVLNGLRISPRFLSLGAHNTMVSFDFNSSSTGMVLFYSKETEGAPVEHKRQLFTINTTITAKSVNFEHNTDGSTIEDLANSPIKDSLIFIQGVSGWDGTVSFPTIANLGRIAVNNAELVMTVFEDPDMTRNVASYLQPPLLLASYKGDDGDYILIEDVLSSSNVILSSFDGVRAEEAVDGDTSTKYRMNISKHLQQIVDGDFTDPTIFLTIFSSAEFPTRVILGGGRNADIGIKLNLTYTNLD